MSRLIDADELKVDYGFTWDDITPTHEELYALIDRQPTIEPEQKTGTWIVYESDNEKYEDIRCPFCQFIYTVDAYHWTDIGFTKDDLEHCPHCGARMVV